MLSISHTEGSSGKHSPFIPLPSHRQPSVALHAFSSIGVLQSIGMPLSEPAVPLVSAPVPVDVPSSIGPVDVPSPVATSPVEVSGGDSVVPSSVLPDVPEDSPPEPSELPSSPQPAAMSKSEPSKALENAPRQLPIVMMLIVRSTWTERLTTIPIPSSQ